MSRPVLEVRSLTKRYALGQGRATRLAEWVNSGPSPAASVVVALDDVSFVVAAGETLGIVGHNGAGKTTLLRILSRVARPTEGRAVVRGRVGSLLEVGTGFHPELTGRDNVYLNGAILGMRRRDIRARFDDIVEFAGVHRFLDTPVKRYSSGMYVRLAFAVAAHLDTEILIVDEVLAVGDISFQRRCLGKIDEVTGQGRTVVFVSHDLGALRGLCDRGLLLDSGRVIADGLIGDVIDTYVGRASARADRVITFVPDDAKAVQYLRASVESTGAGGEIDINDQVTLVLDVATKRRIAGTSVGIALKREGVTVLMSYDTDVDDGNGELRVEGMVSYRVKLPRGLLKAGRYTVDLITEHTSVELIDYRVDALAFEIQELTENLYHHGYARWRQGSIVARLPWHKESS